MDDTPSRGTKRKADERDAVSPNVPRRIRPLDEDVVNKIAAGEIIVAPVHALKELIENAVDAGSTSIEIVVKDGGLKLLQITDNGHGINRDDLPILCERFTTSKIKAFEDLSSIGTYGFRGEALASISHIAHLTVTTKTKNSNGAWRASYADGKLVAAKPGQTAEPKLVAGRDGTQITVEDLFYNVPTRRRAFSSSSEEYTKILDMVGRYAVHCAGVAFSCKKHGEASMQIAVPAAAGTLDRVRLIHGSAVANELLSFNVADDARLGFRAAGWASSANYHAKRTTLLLFINHRAVESPAVRKAVEHVYAPFLPKGGHPFVYASLDIDPQRVDVNVHPTKREVHFLNEEEVIERLCDEIRVQLGNVDTSRTFMTQTLLPGAGASLAAAAAAAAASAGASTDAADGGGRGVGAGGGGGAGDGAERLRKRPYDNNLVRTDAKLRKITSMLPVAQPAPQPSGDEQRQQSQSAAEAQLLQQDAQYQYVDREWVECNLASVAELRAEVRDDVHEDLTEMIAGHSFIGIVDDTKRIAAIQGGVKLYLVDYGVMCHEYFYQLGLTYFGNFGSFRFEPPLPLRLLLSMAAEHEKKQTTTTTTTSSMTAPTKPRDAGAATPLLARPTGSDDSSSSNGMAMDLDEQPPATATAKAKARAPAATAAATGFDWDAAVSRVEQQLVSRRAMLREYFALDISAAGELRGVPLLVRGYAPALAKLPRFLLRLGPHVDWRAEKACFRSFLAELAAFYVPESLPPLPSPSPSLPPSSSLPLPPAGRAREGAAAEGRETGGETEGGGGGSGGGGGGRASGQAARNGSASRHGDGIGNGDDNSGDDDDDDDDADAEARARRAHVHRALEHVLFPAFRARLLGTRRLLRGVVEVANLKGLYRVFERC